MGKHGKWHGLLTTNTALDFFCAYRIYAMRWVIEVSFEEMKGYLGLGKCQARKLTIVDRVWLLIVEVVTEIAGLISADYNELMRAAICGNSHLHAMFVHEYAELEHQKFTCES